MLTNSHLQSAAEFFFSVGMSSRHPAPSDWEDALDQLAHAVRETPYTESLVRFPGGALAAVRVERDGSVVFSF